MILRSGFSYFINIYEKPIYKVNINFDKASIEWRKNKIYLDNGIFQYI